MKIKKLGFVKDMLQTSSEALEKANEIIRENDLYDEMIGYQVTRSSHKQEPIPLNDELLIAGDKIQDSITHIEIMIENNNETLKEIEEINTIANTSEKTIISLIGKITNTNAAKLMEIEADDEDLESLISILDTIQNIRQRTN